MDRILELLESLADASAEEVAELETLIDEAYAEARNPDDGKVDKTVLEQLVAAKEKANERAGEIAAAEAEVADLDAKMADLTADTDDDAETEEDASDDDGGESASSEAPAADDAPADESEEEPVEVPALNGTDGPEIINETPEQEEDEPELVRTAAGGAVPVVELPRLMDEATRQTGMTGAKVTAATMDIDTGRAVKVPRVPVGKFDEQGFVSQVIADKRAERLNAARTAAGGNCGIRTIDYEIGVLGGDCLPVTEAMPRAASEGRQGARTLEFFEDIDFVDYNGEVGVGGTSPGVASYTLAEDETGAEYPKPCGVFACPASVDCDVDIIHKCLLVGNVQDMAWPQWTAAQVQALQNAHSSHREEKHLQSIFDYATAQSNVFTPDLTPADIRGSWSLVNWLLRLKDLDQSATRDCAGSRYIALAPIHAMSQIVSDVALMMNTGGQRLTAEAAVWELLDRAGIDVVFYRDRFGTTPANQVTADGSPTSFVDDPIVGSGGAALRPWPSQARVAMMRDDAPFIKAATELDLGVYRTESDTENNDFRQQMEIFEKLCFRNKHVFVTDVPLCVTGNQPAAVPVVCGDTSGPA